MPQAPTYSSPPRPLTGAYYWLPSPTPSGPFAWSLLTCHDLGRWDGISHRELWPFVVGHLAILWGKAPDAFRRRLGDHYYALPRGRVTNPKGKYLILHGNDSPLVTWREIIVHRFRLHGLQLKSPWDEHERTLREDVLAFEEALGIG